MNSTATSLSQVVPWTTRDAAKAVALVMGGTLLLVVLAVQGLRWSRGGEAMVGLLASAALEGMLLVALWRFGPWRYGQGWQALGLRSGLNNGASLALLVFLASLGFAVLYTATTNWLGLESLAPPPLPHQLFQTYPRRIAAFLVIVVAAPLAEEAFFRGFLVPVFAARWGFWAGAGFASLVFALAHMVPGLAVPAFVSGMLLAWLYRRTGSLWNCCLAHGAQNAMAFAVAIAV